MKSSLKYRDNRVLNVGARRKSEVFTCWVMSGLDKNLSQYSFSVPKLDLSEGLRELCFDFYKHYVSQSGVVRYLLLKNRDLLVHL